MEKALVITLSEAEQEAVEAVNTIMQKHGLPCFLFEPIIYKIYRQIVDGKASELAAAKQTKEDVCKQST